MNVDCWCALAADVIVSADPPAFGATVVDTIGVGSGSARLFGVESGFDVWMARQVQLTYPTPWMYGAVMTEVQD